MYVIYKPIYNLPYRLCYYAHIKTTPENFFILMSIVYPWLAKLSNQFFLHHIKYDPLKLLAEDREFNKIMVEALSRSPTILPEDERT